MTHFTGAKVALINGDKILLIRRDDKPNLPYANMLDFPGGGREHDETPFACIAREVREELGIELHPSSIVYTEAKPSIAVAGAVVYFMVGRIADEEIAKIAFGDEGQSWQMMPIDEYLRRKDAIVHQQARLAEYLRTATSSST